MTEQLPLDVSIIHEAETAAKQHEIAFNDARIAFLTAIEIAADEHRRINRGSSDEADDYDRAVSAVIVTLTRFLDTHLTRVNSAAMFPQLVKLITEEIVSHVVDHTEQLRRLRLDVDRQQMYINEIRRDMERSNIP
jgi:hypothetical protein